jgi:hypothetical protein
MIAGKLINNKFVFDVGWIKFNNFRLRQHGIVFLEQKGITQEYYESERCNYEGWESFHAIWSWSANCWYHCWFHAGPPVVALVAMRVYGSWTLAQHVHFILFLVLLILPPATTVNIIKHQTLPWIKKRGREQVGEYLFSNTNRKNGGNRLFWRNNSSDVGFTAAARP